MDHITEYMAEELYKLGFAMEMIYNEPHPGMVFYKDGQYCVLGGDPKKELPEEAKEIINGAIWLPGTDDLIWWLELHDFDYSVKHDSGEWLIECIDRHTGTKFSSGAGPVCYGLSFAIRKILKRKEREFGVPNWEERGIFKIID